MSDRETPDALRARITDYIEELERLNGEGEPHQLRRRYLLQEIFDLEDELRERLSQPPPPQPPSDKRTL